MTVYTEELVRKIKAGLRAGKTARQIGKELGKSKVAIARKIQRMRGSTPDMGNVLQPMRVRHMPIVHMLDDLILDQPKTDKPLSLNEIARRSGVDQNLIRGWRAGVIPGVGNMDAVLRVLGYRLAVVEDKDDA